MERFHANGWYFAVRPSKNGCSDKWLAWAAQCPVTKQNPIDEPWNLDVYFKFEETREDAIAKLQDEVFNLTNV